jgi:hypothetical protein
LRFEKAFSNDLFGIYKFGLAFPIFLALFWRFVTLLGLF